MFVSAMGICIIFAYFGVFMIDGVPGVDEDGPIYVPDGSNKQNPRLPNYEKDNAIAIYVPKQVPSTETTPTKQEAKRVFITGFPAAEDFNIPDHRNPIAVELITPVRHYPIAVDLITPVRRYPTAVELITPVRRYPTAQQIDNPISQYRIASDLDKTVRLYFIFSKLHILGHRYPVPREMVLPAYY